MLRAMSSPVVYLQLLVMSTNVAAGWCHGWGGTQSSISSMTSLGKKCQWVML